MAGEYELPVPLFLPHRGYDAPGDEAVVEVVLRLVDDEGSIGLQQEADEEEGSSC